MVYQEFLKKIKDQSIKPTDFVENETSIDISGFDDANYDDDDEDEKLSNLRRRIIN